MRKPFIKKVFEVFVIIILLYTNLLMGYFTKTHLYGGNISIQGIFTDLFTPQIFIIALTGALLATFILKFVVKK